MKVFIVSDDRDERDILKLVIRHAGLDVVESADLKHMLANWSNNWANMILLALDESSIILEEIKEVRTTTQVPLMIVVDTWTEARLCAMLKSGADLVLERPVSPRVLASYAQVLLRRTEAIPSFVLPKLESDELWLDPATRTVGVCNQEPRRLTHLEFNLLYVLMTNQDQVIPTDVIVDRVWGYSGRGDRELVRGLISRLRHKLEPGAKRSQFIQTIPGVGYTFSLHQR